jgi:hypothetical protein
MATASAAVAAVQVPDLARLLLAHHAGQEGGAVAGVHRAHLGADLAELALSEQMVRSQMVASTLPPPMA